MLAPSRFQYDASRSRSVVAQVGHDSAGVLTKTSRVFCGRSVDNTAATRGPVTPVITRRCLNGQSGQTNRRRRNATVTTIIRACHSTAVTRTGNGPWDHGVGTSNSGRGLCAPRGPTKRSTHPTPPDYPTLNPSQQGQERLKTSGAPGQMAGAPVHNAYGVRERRRPCGPYAHRT